MNIVCRNHFEDKSLQNYVSNNGTKGKCDICGKNRNCLSIAELSEYIERCIGLEYVEPYSEGAGYDKEAVYYEDRFPGLNVRTAEDVLLRELDLIDDSDDLLYRISLNFDNDYWVGREMYGPSDNEYLRGGWDHFREIVKHKIRFVLFDKNNQDAFEDRYGETMNPYFVLKAVGDIIKDLKLITSFETNELKVYRGRQHEKCDKAGNSVILDTAVELGSPPVNFAKANRMSPAGISMFYGAFKPKTCINEIIDESWKESSISYGLFSNNEKLNLVDFTKVDKVPSLFNIKNRKNREIVKFIKEFIQDLGRPVKSDDSVHIDYVPTQIVTEYIKYLFPNNVNIDGIIYNSVKNTGEKCVVLFAENSDAEDKYPKESVEPETKKVFESFFGSNFENTQEPFPRKLYLDNKTVQTLKIEELLVSEKEL